MRSLYKVVTHGVVLSLLSLAACAAEPSEPSQDGQDSDQASAATDDSEPEGQLDGGATVKRDAGGKAGRADSGLAQPGAGTSPTGAVRADSGPADASSALDPGNNDDASAADAQVASGTGDPQPSDGASLWISPTGSDQASGTKEQPLKTLSAAHERAMPGMTIWVSAGTYLLSKTVPLTRSGQEGKPIAVFAAPGERPVFDFAGQPRGDSASRGLQISGDYWYLRGVDVVNAGDNCVNISGAHNTIEHVVMHGCSDTGLQITANGSQASDATRAAYNTVLNCDSYENYDAQNQGENADGFAAKLYIGPGNVFRGCRAWNNSDDGWDLFASDDVVVIENSWAIANGKIGPTQSNTNGDGNGFKLGGAAKAGDANQGGAVHKVTDCISISNGACGFVRNNNTRVPELTHCGGQGDGKGTYCSLTNSGAAGTVSMTAAQAIAVVRDADGNLPKMK